MFMELLDCFIKVEELLGYFDRAYKNKIHVVL